MNIFQLFFLIYSTHGLSVKVNRCYNCSETRDQTGTTLAGSNCFEPQPESLVSCSGLCLDEMSFDWAINGRQIIKLERFCAGSTWQESFCESGEASGGKYKDCKKYCDGDACNNDLSVGMIGKSLPLESRSCLVCANDDDGKMESKSCQDAENIEAEKCPLYLSEGCFTAFSALSIDAFELVENNGAHTEEFHRGCSAFVLESDFESISREWYNGQFAKARREFCDETSCNDKFIDIYL
ncbi:unnamed protein product [Oikopleura dioica]|uniref:Protein quiver n=1 Tax=Oikopleura dioica TaxID=34765 RepID=E4X1Y3_OIKDI|nr:unnamed protein product [Oikopleura dioica]